MQVEQAEAAVAAPEVDQKKIDKKKSGRKKVTGQAEATGVANLEFKLSNGKVECVVGDAKPGEAKLSWTIKRQKNGFTKGGKPKDLDVRVEQQGDRLVVEDHWCGKKKACRPIINMVLELHPDTLVQGSMGNGKLTVENHKITGLRMGNGKVVLGGELSEDSQIKMGNGVVKGSVLITAGKHRIKMGNGVVKLEAAAGSSFKFNSKLATGRTTVNGVESTSKKRFLGGATSAVIGDGAGTLDISVGNGRVKLDVEAGAALGESS